VSTFVFLFVGGVGRSKERLEQLFKVMMANSYSSVNYSDAKVNIGTIFSLHGADQV
jgi:hypothetical protein